VTRLMVTRPADQAGSLVSALAARGVSSVSVPTIAVVPGEATALDDTLRSLPGARWLVITSVNGAAALLDRLEEEGMAIPDGTRLAAVGPATAAALRAGGLHVGHVPAEYRTVAIADGLGEVAGRRVVLARADSASADLALALRSRGALVEEVVAYRTCEGPEASRAKLADVLEEGVDGVTFTSGSTVRGLLRLAEDAALNLPALPAYCIGPVTAEVARQAGFSVPVVAAEHTAAALAAAIAAHLSTEVA
jgi:uroporphyrinogen-III synthase